MPKFVWLKNALLGPMPSVIHDDSVFGVAQDKDIGVLQKHDIEVYEAGLPLDALSLKYPYVKPKCTSEDCTCTFPARCERYNAG